MQVLPNLKNLAIQDGIWHAPKNAFVSYPTSGNDFYFKIEDNSFWFRHRNDCIVEAIKRNPPPGLFFDIGGGNGYVSKGIQNAGFDTVLVEPDYNGCMNARSRNIKNIICSTIEDAGFDPGTIPAMGAFDVVEHFEDDLRILGTISKYLQKDGMFYMTVPAYNFLWSVDDDYLGHFNRYTLAEIERKFNSVGLKVEYSTYFFTVLPAPILLLRTLPSRLKIARNPADSAHKNKEHVRKSPIPKAVLDWELNRIKAKKTIPFGGSCLVAARKM